MKVWITGANGMVGRNLKLHVSSSNYEVLTPTSRELDLRDYRAVSLWIRREKPDLVIHCAGKVGGIQANIDDPVNFLLHNIDVGRNVLIASANNGVSRVINLGSSCMYPRDAANPLREEFIGNGALEPSNEGYALAKIIVARLSHYLSETEKVSFKTVIPCNIFGYYDKFDPEVSHLIPAIIKKIDDAMRSGRLSVDIWGDGSARREFLFAEDLADALWTCVENFESIPDVMNIGYGKDFTISEFYRMAAEAIGWDGDFVYDHSKPVGMQRKIVDTTRQTLLGWRPKTSLKDGLRLTYKFYCENVIMKGVGS